MRKSKITVKGGCCKKREMRNFAGVRGIVSWADGNLRRSNFDQLNIFQSYKQQSANTEPWLKSKLAWPVHAKSTKGQWK